jgi:hypothetical protein
LWRVSARTYDAPILSDQLLNETRGGGARGACDKGDFAHWIIESRPWTSR